MKVYHVETQKDYDSLMSELEEKGYKWLSGHKPTYFKFWEQLNANAYIKISGKDITCGYLERFKKQYPNIPIIEYKAKEEKMTQEEMKQNIIDWARDVSVAVESFAKDIKFEVKKSTVEYDLQEAKSSAKKLIEKIDEYLESQKHGFKVGDYATFDIPSNKKIAKIDRVNGDKLHGLWYDTKSKDIEPDYYGSGSGTAVKHATPTEIAEYEVALNFHKHGRKPFEVKDGDLLDNVFGKYIAHEHSFSKEDFTVGGNTLLKTAEEVNEWLENK